jgi:hypothetical protein
LKEFFAHVNQQSAVATFSFALAEFVEAWHTKEQVCVVFEVLDFEIFRAFFNKFVMF